MPYVMKRTRKGYFSLVPGRDIKDAGLKTPLLILNIKYINIIMSQTHKISLKAIGHNVWTIQIEYGISTILYGSYNS